MRIIKYLILFITLYNIIQLSTSTLLPPSPGTIDSSQLNSEPVVSYYNLAGNSVNGLYPIGSGCNKLSNRLSQDYMPIVILNDTSYLATTFGKDFEIAIVTSEGAYQVEIQSGLKKLAAGGAISSAISYDDKLNSFIFVNRDGFTTNIITYSIDKDSYTSSSIKNAISFPFPYYDLTTSTYYVAAVVIGDVSFIVYTQESMEIYSISDFQIDVNFVSVQVSGYNGKVVLFGKNPDSETSYLYLIDLSTKQSQLILQASFTTNMITSVNPRYILLIQQDTMQLIDLESPSSTNIFISACPELEYTNSFISSLVIKDIFN